MSVSNTIKQQLKDKVEACSSVQVVYGSMKNNPSGWPAVFVTPADVEGEFSSNAENSRIYSFNLACAFPIGEDYPAPDNEDRLEYAEETIATVIDEIINAVDTDFELDGSPVLYVNAADLYWDYYDYEGGEARAANITLRVYTEITVV